MHKWSMPIERPHIDWQQYDTVTICSPIWVFALSAPIRSFCKAAAGKIKNVHYVLVHYQKYDYKNAVKEMDNILGITHKSAKSICCRKGKYIKETSL